MFTNKAHEEAEKERKAGNQEKAIEYYTKALIEAPNDCNILSDRGVAYLHLNNQELCLKDLDLAVDLQPDYAFRYSCRAYAKRRFGDLDGAVSDYEKAVELDPEDSIAHNNLGLILEERGYQKKAEERFARADKLSKLEDQLLDVVDELEDQSNEKTTSSEIVHEKQSSPSRFNEFKKLFTDKNQFKEFIQFIKNGFKIPK